MSQQAAAVLSQLSSVTEEVRDFYDRYPYPPPVDSLEQYRQRWDAPQRRRGDFHLFWPGAKYREDYSILVAGCGTSQAAKHALRWPSAQVIGIDCSATSIRHTERLKKQYHIKNLHLQQLAIEQVSELGLSFDQIVCTGVLHHLEDPPAGLSALRDVLKPDGAMQLMVYASYGRAGIYMLQEFCRRIGISPRVSPDDRTIRDLITALCALPAGHPLQAMLKQAPELLSEAALADSLLHPQDRAYSVPQFLELIQNSGLIFGRWLRQAPYSVHCGVIRQLPQFNEISRLPFEEQYAVVELFRGTMSRHSAVIYRSQRQRSLHDVSFDAGGWLSYVPIRVSDAICVEDRVPDGTAAVLINRTHTYKDLFLAIGEKEKHLFDGIDGQSTIAEIAEKTMSPSDRESHFRATRIFFEQLWWYDQVVFDTGHWKNIGGTLE
jgi:2-polyprenyl-3-methyl-5-hydroxy-6-metoxy-1,4-benzoquinol methylase